MSPTAAMKVAATMKLTPGTVINRLTSGQDSRAQLGFVVEYREEEVGFLDGSAQEARVLTDFFGG